MITTFTPFEAALGGALIGLAATALMALHGRIAGMTGILSGALFSRGGLDWRLAFLAGAIAAPALIFLFTGNPLAVQADLPRWALVAGGLLVGIGATFGGGCTSGHGVCGIARLSARSITATLTFMATTFATVFVVRHLLGGI